MVMKNAFSVACLSRESTIVTYNYSESGISLEKLDFYEF